MLSACARRHRTECPKDDVQPDTGGNERKKYLRRLIHRFYPDPSQAAPTSRTVDMAFE
ncbi:protein of unknown function [Bradyrhizobium vignae]|uniref:Uncharacterized protein n=1 Tax=Bradyrhizobium vignae TaxID=1549949 RepID=A0A2U3PUE8_9BRAD|nr:protein of unknown function [Bradyrhizobium vignae]